MTKTKSGIYQIKNLITNEIYIGSSKHLASRKAGHFCRLRKGKHQNPILQNHWNKKRGLSKSQRLQQSKIYESTTK
jgi:hypothetical protein